MGREDYALKHHDSSQPAFIITSPSLLPTAQDQSQRICTHAYVVPHPAAGGPLLLTSIGWPEYVACRRAPTGVGGLF